MDVRADLAAREEELRKDAQRLLDRFRAAPGAETSAACAAMRRKARLDLLTHQCADVLLALYRAELYGCLVAPDAQALLQTPASEWRVRALRAGMGGYALPALALAEYRDTDVHSLAAELEPALDALPLPLRSAVAHRALKELFGALRLSLATLAAAPAPPERFLLLRETTPCGDGRVVSDGSLLPLEILDFWGHRVLRIQAAAHAANIEAFAPRAEVRAALLGRLRARMRGRSMHLQAFMQMWTNRERGGVLALVQPRDYDALRARPAHEVSGVSEPIEILAEARPETHGLAQELLRNTDVVELATGPPPDTPPELLPMRLYAQFRLLYGVVDALGLEPRRLLPLGWGDDLPPGAPPLPRAQGGYVLMVAGALVVQLPGGGAPLFCQDYADAVLCMLARGPADVAERAAQLLGAESLV